MVRLVEFDAMVGDLGDMAKEKGEKRMGGFAGCLGWAVAVEKQTRRQCRFTQYWLELLCFFLDTMALLGWESGILETTETLRQRGPARHLRQLLQSSNPFFNRCLPLNSNLSPYFVINMFATFFMFLALTTLLAFFPNFVFPSCFEDSTKMLHKRYLFPEKFNTNLSSFSNRVVVSSIKRDK